MPYLAGKKKTAPHEALCWRNGENAGARKGNWKLFKGGERYWLYDLSKDIGERQNVADKSPAIVAQLEKELVDWETRIPGSNGEIEYLRKGTRSCNKVTALK